MVTDRAPETKGPCKGRQAAWIWVSLIRIGQARDTRVKKIPNAIPLADAYIAGMAGP
jgi:hypothetical protein